MRASDCDKKVQLASSDAQKLNSQIADQEAVIKTKDTVIKTDEQKIQTLSQQKKDLEADMAAHKKLIDQLNDSIKNKQSQIDKLMKDLSSSQTSYDSTIKSMVEQINLLKAEVAAHQSEKKKLEASILDLNNQYKDAIKKIAQLQASAGADHAQIAGMATTINDYTKQLQKAQQSIAAVSAKLAEISKSVESLTQQRKDALDLVKKYQIELGKDVRVVGLDSQREKVLQRIIGKLRAHVKGLNFKLHRMAAVNRNLKGLMREHRFVISGLKTLIRSSPSPGRVQEMNRALLASRRTIKVLMGELQQMQHKFKQLAKSSRSPSGDGDFRRIKIWIHNQLQMSEQTETASSDSASLAASLASN